MERVVVCVKRENQKSGVDLEVPSDLEAAYLAAAMARALGHQFHGNDQPVSFVIRAEFLGRDLRPNESLEAAGIWDGATLLLREGAPTSPKAQRKWELKLLA